MTRREPVEPSPTNVVIDSGEIRLHALDWAGDGEPVVCLPGITANAHAFTCLAEEVAPERRVIAVDLRGRGGSDKPSTGYDVRTHVRDLCGLLEQLGVSRVSIIGWSLGAKVALAAAAWHPQMVTALVLLDPPVATSAAAAAALQAFWARLDRTYLSTDAFLQSMRPSFPYWNRYVEEYLLADVAVGADGVVRHLISRSVPERELEAENEVLTRPLYPSIHCPVLIIRSTRPMVREGDQVLSKPDAVQMAKAIKRAQLLEVDGADHLSVLLAKPAPVVETVVRFLRAPS